MSSRQSSVSARPGPFLAAVLFLIASLIGGFVSLLRAGGNTGALPFWAAGATLVTVLCLMSVMHLPAWGRRHAGWIGTVLIMAGSIALGGLLPLAHQFGWPYDSAPLAPIFVVGWIALPLGAVIFAVSAWRQAIFMRFTLVIMLVGLLAMNVITALVMPPTGDALGAAAVFFGLLFLAYATATRTWPEFAVWWNEENPAPRRSDIEPW